MNVMVLQLFLEGDHKKKMKEKVVLILFAMLFFPAIALSQVAIDSVNYKLKKSDYDGALYWAEKVSSPQLKQLFLYQITYYQTGVKNNIDLVAPFSRLSLKDLALYHYLLGDYFNINKNKFKSYTNYYQSYQNAIKTNKSQLKTASLNRLTEHLIFNKRDDTLDIQGYMYEFKNNRVDEIDDFWYYYRAIQTKFLVKDFKLRNHLIASNEVSNFLNKEMNNLFSKLEQMAKNNTYHLALYYQIFSAYQADWLHDYEKANSNLLKAKLFYKQVSSHQAKEKSKGVDYNRAINYFKNKKFDKAIPLFKQNLKREKKDLYVKSNYFWLHQCYKSIHDLENALKYYEKMDSIDNKLNRGFRDIDRYQKDQVKTALKSQITVNKQLNKRLITVLPVLGFITAILIFIFYLYKRYKKKSSVLEDEQSETLQRLDELKSIVIKNHIVLKDNTKIYISELMYIKSDDHYLKIFTQEGKDRLVRGKLSQIKEELPPNFIQCHRSYIVNRNFIKQINSNSIILINKEQIPLSRSYKSKI